MTYYIVEESMPYGALTGAWYKTFGDGGNGPAQAKASAFLALTPFSFILRIIALKYR
jgi:hypothetical protein